MLIYYNEVQFICFVTFSQTIKYIWHVVAFSVIVLFVVVVVVVSSVLLCLLF